MTDENFLIMNRPPMGMSWSDDLERLFMAIVAVQKQIDQANNSVAEIRKKARDLVLSVARVK